MIRKTLLTFCFSSMIVLGSMAQGHMQNQVNTYSDEGSGTGFKKENLFVGGGLGLGFSSYDFNVGINPEVGYSLNRWLDVGLVANYEYYSEKADPYYNNDTRTHEFIYGGGAFARAWFLPFLFATVQPEFNWTSVNEKYADGTTYKYNANAPSVILGVGYGQRNVGSSSFYIMLGLDVAGSKNSPYNDFNGNPMPVVRAGFDVFVHKRS